MDITIGNVKMFIMLIRPKYKFEATIVIVWFFTAIELFAMLLAAVYIPFTIRILDKSPLLHRNLVRISQATLLMYYLSIPARIALLLSEFGVLAEEGMCTHAPYYSSIPFLKDFSREIAFELRQYTSPATENAGLHSEFALKRSRHPAGPGNGLGRSSNLDYIIIATAAFVRTWSSCVAAVYLPAAIIERGFASKFIKDYEKNSRKWISAVIVLSVYVVSAIDTAILLVGYVSLFYFAMGFALFIVLCCSSYTALYRRDSAKLRDISRGVIKKNVVYTLSTKFQLKENLRVMKIHCIMLKVTIGEQEIFLVIICPEVANAKDVIYWILIIIENLITCLALALLITFYPNAVGRVVITFYESGILAYDGYCNEMIASILIAVIFLIYCTTFITIFRRDSTRLRNLDNHMQKKVIYTLSTKFQLKENLKVMKILMHQSIVEAVNTVIGCSLFILTKTVLENDPQWIPAAHVLSDMCFAISFCMIALVYMVALREVRFRLLPSWSSKIREMHRTQYINEHRGASDAYFKQLSNAW
ncbi:unnamed protein product [Haemonchus placei]|uniref:G_PROTEIN_RECEP_F1_2 domain-containing protein n=1 Tax=Haemonchus placei TaxID=6290 RepID=A0A158QR85_HAEPC|nr:unnamed protein product [Haemonchus placei]